MHISPVPDWMKVAGPLDGFGQKTSTKQLFQDTGITGTPAIYSTLHQHNLPTTMYIARGNGDATLFFMIAARQSPSGYPELLQELKTRIRGAQVRAALAVNRELVLLY